jgi:glycosyltransferase involved in cell wall biosynthesis
LEIARGIQNKILEAMAAGAPVLTTPVAAKGLPGDAQHTLFVVPRDPAIFAAAVLRLLDDPLSLELKAASAQAFVRRHCTWESNVDILDGLILDAKPDARRPARRIREAAGVSAPVPGPEFRDRAEPPA